MKILGNILYGLLILTLIAVAGLFLSSLLPIPGHIEVKIVKSGSMEPAIPTGSIVIMQPEDFYAVGDIITFGEDSKVQIPTTHRIVSIRDVGGEPQYTTKGDANNAPDPDETPMSKVIGKVLLAIPYAGYILDFARQPIGFTFLIVIPALVIIIDETTRIIQEIVALRRARRAPIRRV